MSGERVLGSYIVRVSVRSGDRVINVHDVVSGTTCRFEDYDQLGRHLAAREDVESPDAPEEGESRRSG